MYFLVQHWIWIVHQLLFTDTANCQAVFFFFITAYFWLQKHTTDFYIDLHAHSTLMNGFMYGNTYEDVERVERHSVFPRLLCTNAEDFSLANTNYNRDAVKAGTGRR